MTADFIRFVVLPCCHVPNDLVDRRMIGGSGMKRTLPLVARFADIWNGIFLLEGDLTDLRLDETFHQGMYACRPPGMVHGPWRSASGVLMLEIRYPALPHD